MRYKFKKEKVLEYSRFYRRHGFVVLEDFFELKNVEDLRKELSRILRSEKDIECALVDSFNESLERYLSALGVFTKSAKVQKLFLDEKILSALKNIGFDGVSTPTTPVSHVVDNRLTKNGIDDVALGFHQDWTSVQGSLGLAIVWLPLTDVDEESRPVQIVPGSHLEGIREDTTIDKNSRTIKDLLLEEKVFEVHVKKSDILIFSGYTIHRTKRKGSKFRVALSQRFEDFGEESFFSRGFPCAYKRVVDRDLKYRPSVEEIGKVFEKEF